MNTHRCYLEKNNTIIKNSSINTAKNQVTEILYGGVNKIFTKYIFKLDLSSIIDNISKKEITEDKITSHILYFKNTINKSPKYLSNNIINHSLKQRTSSFKLILFKINEEWDEGNGYDFKNTDNFSGSNWYNKSSTEFWATEGIYNDNNLEIIDTLDFDNGNEDFILDLTDEINNIIYRDVPNHGYGISFSPEYGNLETDYIQSVFFHTKYTHTFFEPYLETKISNVINDDRNCFHLDYDNRLYFYAKRGKNFFNIDLKEVNIYDTYNNLITKILPPDINKHSKGVYYINLNLDSSLHYDSVLYRDQWVYEVNETEKEITNTFYLMGNEDSEDVENNLTSIHIFGLKNRETIKRGEEVEVEINFKTLYDKMINLCEYEINYDLYIKQGEDNIYIVEEGNVNRVPNKNFILFDTSILIQNKYFLKINLKYKNKSLNNTEIMFNIVNN